LHRGHEKTKCSLFSVKQGTHMDYCSTITRESATHPGIRYVIRRPSLQRRAEITRKVRQLLAELEYRAAGDSLEDQLSAAELESRIDGAYLEWGLERVEGLIVDGEPCNPRTLIERGPEDLGREIAEAIRRECRLSEEERKN
jgi:hypothetical protein